MKNIYTYKNDLGRIKQLVVYDMENGKYPVVLWDLATGEWAGNGELSPEELERYLGHYGIKA